MSKWIAFHAARTSPIGTLEEAKTWGVKELTEDEDGCIKRMIFLAEVKYMSSGYTLALEFEDVRND
jgi:hypothetical protein